MSLSVGAPMLMELPEVMMPEVTIELAVLVAESGAVVIATGQQGLHLAVGSAARVGEGWALVEEDMVAVDQAVADTCIYLSTIINRGK